MELIIEIIIFFVQFIYYLKKKGILEQMNNISKFPFHDIFVNNLMVH